ncbi:MAG: hypothetical protein WKG01_42115 [Kofleriaceae bacterium]
MKRALAIGCGLVAIVLALSWWRCRDPGAPHGPAVGSHASLPPRVVVPQDPGAIAGAVLDDKRAPIAGATVAPARAASRPTRPARSACAISRRRAT